MFLARLENLQKVIGKIRNVYEECKKAKETRENHEESIGKARQNTKTN